jgi:hypothetical protein
MSETCKSTLSNKFKKECISLAFIIRIHNTKLIFIISTIQNRLKQAFKFFLAPVKILPFHLTWHHNLKFYNQNFVCVSTFHDACYACRVVDRCGCTFHQLKYLLLPRVFLQTICKGIVKTRFYVRRLKDGYIIHIFVRHLQLCIRVTL